MAELSLHVGGRAYSVACRDGEEAHLTFLAATVDKKVRDARSAVGDTSETRQLLLAALLLADELQDQAAAAPQQEAKDDAHLVALEQLAERVEQMAARLETRG